MGTEAMGKAMYAAAPRDPDVLRAYLDIASLLATPDEALAEPGLLGKVIALGANAPRYTTPGPSRAELLAAIDATIGATAGAAIGGEPSRPS